MNELREETIKEATASGEPRKARRKSAAWKSGLMLAGLGAVVLGAGYLAGINTPAVAQANAAQAAAPAVAPLSDDTDDDELIAPENAAPQQFSGRGARQFSGSTQQLPSFRGPVARSRGS